MVLYNSIIPFKGFIAMNIFGIIFVRKELKERLTPKILNHEYIHTAQIKELLGIGFYLIYLLEWIYRFLFTKDRFKHQAYRNISFEKEAREHESDFEYLKNRKHFSMWRK